MKRIANDNVENVADDLLRGAEEIAVFLYGDPSHRQKVYRAASKHSLPVFRIGETIHARKSKIVAWIEEQERAGQNKVA